MRRRRTGFQRTDVFHDAICPSSGPNYVIVRRHPDGRVEVSHDHYIEGLFPRQRWLDLMTEVGFVDATSQVDEEDRVVFAGRRLLEVV